METKQFEITGMSCAACSAHIEKAVKQLDGVEAVQVSLLTNKMEVRYNSDTVPEQAIIQAVTKGGYGAAPVQGDAAGTTPNNEATDRAAEDSDNMRKHFIISLLFLVPLMFVSMGHMLGIPVVFLHRPEHAVSFALTQLLLTLPVIVLNRHFFTGGLKSLVHGAPNMNSLIAVGSGAGLVYSIFALYRIGYYLGHGDMESVSIYMHDLYFESSAMIVTLISFGKFLEARAKKKTSQAITKLIQLRPKTACVIRNNEELTVPVESIVQGDCILIRPGETIPVDGTIVEGASSLDEAALTGESMPVEKKAGDYVMSASHNQSGSFVFRAEKVGNETTLARIIALVEQAASSKAPVAKLADTISGYFVPIVMAISLCTFIGWLIAGAAFDFALSTAIAVLVISCPCALGLATPTAIMVGTGRGAQLGILIKSAESLEKAHHIRTVLLDKTGTITEGKPVLQMLTVFSPLYTADELLRIAYSLELLSEHPLAHAVIQAAQAKHLAPFKLQGFTAVHGKGIYGTVAAPECEGGSAELPQALKAGTRIAAGNLALCTDLSVPLSDTMQKQLEYCARNAYTPLFVIVDAVCAALIGVSDPVKPSSTHAIEQLHALGVHTVMLTGDNRKTAEAIQKQVSVKDFVSELLPQDKQALVEKYRQQGCCAFIGDGINDAPALMTADVGIAIGGGTDIAIESADIVLMNSDLETAVAAIQLSKAVMRTIKQNLFWALFYNSLCIPLAAGVFYKIFGLTLSPMIAAAAMSFSSVSVVSNALRLSRFHVIRRIADTQHINKEKEETMNVTTVIKIEGMSCKHCVAHVEKALQALDGVSASVSLEEKQATITHPDSVTLSTLKQAITDAGYTPVEG